MLDVQILIGLQASLEDNDRYSILVSAFPVCLPFDVFCLRRLLMIL